MWTTFMVIAGIALALGSKEAAGGIAAIGIGIAILTTIVGVIF